MLSKIGYELFQNKENSKIKNFLNSWNEVYEIVLLRKIKI